jgi:hypothetical protein
MNKFFQLQQDIFAQYVAHSTQEDILGTIDFGGGAIIQKALPVPLIFETDHSMQEPPKGILSNTYALMSDELVEALQEAGGSNLQCFPAEVRSRADGTIWKNYKVVNVIGLVSCADLKKSEYTKIGDRPGDDAVPLMAFEILKIDPARAGDQLLFILAESPGTIIVAGCVVDFLRSKQSDDDWGITLDERS